MCGLAPPSFTAGETPASPVDACVLGHLPAPCPLPSFQERRGSLAAYPGRLWYEEFGAGGVAVKESGLDDGDAAWYGEGKDGGETL